MMPFRFTFLLAEALSTRRIPSLVIMVADLTDHSLFFTLCQGLASFSVDG